MESSNRQGSGNLSAFITGALLGAGLALLFAPQAGVQARKLLREYSARAKDGLDKTVDHGVQVLEHGQELVEKGKDSFREIGRQVGELAEAGRKAFNETKEEFSSRS